MDRVKVAIAIGSNQGDRAAHLEFARLHLTKALADFQMSSAHETEPVGVEPGQSMYLNAAATGRTALTARALLETLLEIERARGRTRPYAGAARTLDLDLLLFGDAIIDQEGLVVPHPRMRERAFVLEPLAEVAPDLVDPVTGQTIEALLRELRGTSAASRQASPSLGEMRRPS